MDHSETARLILPVWGRRYIDLLRDATLPALLAPGNLPSLAERHRLTFVIATTRSDARALDALSVTGDLRRLCNVEFRDIDDLVHSRNMYGVSLTHAMHRGFADLGSRVCETSLFFLYADFVLDSEGLSAIDDRLRAGAGAVLAPSWCAIAEDVMPRLRPRHDEGKLVLSQREIAGLALRHRHDTVAARTVNDGRFHMPLSDQYLWAHGNDVLVGRQFPMPLLAVAPECPYGEPVNFWDYAALPVMRPDGNWIVLNDSDAFALLELRERDYAMGDLLPGPVELTGAGAKLGRIATGAQRWLGRHKLILHTRDVPDANRFHQPLDHAMETVEAAFPETPPSERDSPHWRVRVRRFESDDSAGHAGEGGLSGLGAVYRLLFGRVPLVRPWHPLRAALSVPCGVLADLKFDQDMAVLFLASDRALFMRWVRQKVANVTLMSPHDLLDDYGQGHSVDYAVAILELSRRDLRLLPELVSKLRRVLAPRGKIVVIHLNLHGSDLPPPLDDCAIQEIADVVEEPRWLVARSRLAMRLAAIYSTSLELTERMRPWMRPIAVAAVLFMLAPVALVVRPRTTGSPATRSDFVSVVGRLRLG